MAATTTLPRRTAVRGLGEIALRVCDLDAMQRFYQETIGLPLMSRTESYAFFKIGDGYGGHAQVLALFDRTKESSYRGVDAKTSTMDHLAFEISLDDYAAEKERLEVAGLKVVTAEHAWVHWRSIYVVDPEGNEVELVCYDAAVE